jgi:two-component system nitrogen regulation sensor histidine kinase GlnL
MTTPVLVFDRAMRLRDMNPAAEELLDLSVKQCVGVQAQRMLDDAVDCHRALRRVLDNDQSVTERGMRLPVSGGAITVDCAITPLGGDEEGAIMEFVVLDRHMQISREERLVAESESARAVLRGLAHEIRNPLGGLRTRR